MITSHFAVLQKVIGKKCCTQIIRIAAEYVNCKVDIQDSVDNTFKIITGEGSELCDVLSGLRYFARMRPDVALYGRTFDDIALVDSWLEYCDSSVKIPLMAWMSWESLQGECIEKIKSDVVAPLADKIEAHFLQNTFLVGERLTIADINLAWVLNRALTMDANILKSFSNTQRWLNLVLAQPIVHKHISGVNKDAKCPVQKDKKEAVSKKVDAPKKEGAKKEAEQKELSAADIEDQIAAEEKARSKKANPLDALPPSPLNLDAWKREYSNTKDLKGVAMPWFWTHFDSEGYSLWYMRYEKMEGENTVGYTTANMVGGFLQRLDANFRKYSFGVINVVGADKNFDIQGVWLMRGQEIPFELKDHPSFEYHTFRKLDAVTDKALIEDYWCNDE